MVISISKNSAELGRKAASLIAAELRACIMEKGSARLLLSTGASQFDMYTALIEEDVDWGKVEMFHLDEYIGITDEHPASFKKYLKERFVSKLSIGTVNYVEPGSDAPAAIEALNEKLLEKPVDIGVIGIGENGHIAFNDPPADFETTDPFITVTLDEACKKQQVGEGWFPTLDDVPKQAISMSVFQIMMSRKIISVVPHGVKAEAVKKTLTLPVSPEIPAAALKLHPEWHLFLDDNSASKLDRAALTRFIAD